MHSSIATKELTGVDFRNENFGPRSTATVDSKSAFHRVGGCYRPAAPGPERCVASTAAVNSNASSILFFGFMCLIQSPINTLPPGSADALLPWIAANTANRTNSAAERAAILG